MLPVPHCTLGSIEQSLVSSTFRLVETYHRSDLRLQRHGHAYAGITLVNNGFYREQCDGAELDCRSGMLVYKPAGFIHSNRYGPRGAHALHLEIVDQSLLDDVRLPDKVIVLSIPRVAYVATALAKEFEVVDAVTSLTVDALGLELVSLIVRQSRENATTSAPLWLDRAMQRIQNCRGEIPSLRDVAGMANLPPRQVSREFRRWLGCSVGEWVRRKRIEEASRRLRETDQAIAAIAVEIGFCDQSHFSRVFRGQVGLTPAKYRALCHKDGRQ